MTTWDDCLIKSVASIGGTSCILNCVDGETIDSICCTRDNVGSFCYGGDVVDLVCWLTYLQERGFVVSNFPTNNTSFFDIILLYLTDLPCITLLFVGNSFGYGVIPRRADH